MVVDECLEPGCFAPVTETLDGGHWADGVDFDGADVEFYLAKYVCLSGHVYHVVDESKTRMTL